MLAQMSPYTPSLYQPNGYGRYRQYPRQVTTPIPGAGYDVGEMVWAEQELNLDGSDMSQPYGDYAQVPLRGLGVTLPLLNLARPGLVASNVMFRTETAPPPLTTTAPPPESTTTGGGYVYEAPPPAVPPEVSPGFFSRKVGPVPVWALGAGGLAVAAGGLGWLWMKRKGRR